MLSTLRSVRTVHSHWGENLSLLESLTIFKMMKMITRFVIVFSF